MPDPYCLCASFEWKLGIHLAEWKAARELAYRLGRHEKELGSAHFEGVVQLVREHLEAMEETHQQPSG